MFANTGRGATGQGARDLAMRADALGIESLWTVEHPPFSGDALETIATSLRDRFGMD